MSTAPKTPAQPSYTDPNERILKALKKAVAVVPDPDKDLADGIAADLENFLERQIPPTPKIDDPCVKPRPEVAPFCVQQRRALSAADNTFSSAELSARNALKSALNTWALALSEYEYEMENAQVQFEAAQGSAADALDKKINKDSTSRDLYLYYTMKETVAAAVQTLETSAASASAQLSGAAGTLLGAYATYVGAIDAAQSQLMVDKSTAQQSFWQNVETVLDAT